MKQIAVNALVNGKQMVLMMNEEKYYLVVGKTLVNNAIQYGTKHLEELKSLK